MRRRHVTVELAIAAMILGMLPSNAVCGRLDDIIPPGAQAEVLGTGYGFSEGPAADAEGNIYFSDGKNNAIYFYRPGRKVSLFVNDSTDANGMMFNRRGELIVCEGAAYHIVAFDVMTKTKRILVGEGKRQFNEPNDLAIDSTGGFYFTDPNYRHRGQKPLRKEDAYYCSASGEVSRVSDTCQTPNGILLTPDEKTLYLADNRGKVLYKYDVVAPGKLANERLWIDLGAGPDGMTLDEQGNLYIACGRAGVKVYSSSGKSIGVIDQKYGVPYASNCVFGSKNFTTLYMTSRDRFLGLKTKVTGVKPLPLRR